MYRGANIRDVQVEMDDGKGDRGFITKTFLAPLPFLPFLNVSNISFFVHSFHHSSKTFDTALLSFK